MKIPHVLTTRQHPPAESLLTALRGAESAETVLDFTHSPLMFRDDRLTEEFLEGAEFKAINMGAGKAPTYIINKIPAGTLLSMLEQEMVCYSNPSISTTGKGGGIGLFG